MRLLLEATAETWEAAKELGLELGGWVFRGQEQSAWDLASSLERELEEDELGEIRETLREVLGGDSPGNIGHHFQGRLQFYNPDVRS